LGQFWKQFSSSLEWWRYFHPWHGWNLNAIFQWMQTNLFIQNLWNFISKGSHPKILNLVFFLISSPLKVQAYIRNYLW
jgi:hypothetical protein